MSMRSVHGTDCFEVEAFIVRNEESKLFKVRHKTSDHFYVMEVAARNGNSHELISTNLQETRYNLSKFWVNMKFTFRTSSKLYFILDYVGERTLSSLCGLHGALTEVVVQFYASEILNALDELHSHGCVYGNDLGLDKVYIDNTGHVVLWRNFCGKTYWTREECVCSMYGFTNGRYCENSHGKCLERELKNDYQLLGLVILQMLSQEHYAAANNKTSPQEGLSYVVSNSFSLPSSLSTFARDLITRLLKGQFYNTSHIKTHPFFLGINWKMIQARLTTPPTITRKVSFRPSLRKTSSEACLYVEPITSPPPPRYIRPSTPGIPINYTNDHHMDTHQYVQNSPPHPVPYHAPHPSTRPAPPRRLRSALSSPDLSMFGREPEPSPWTREPVEVEPRYHDNHYQPIDATSRYVSQSMADLHSIDTSYNRPRTSSFTDRNIVAFNGERHDRKISQHLSYPPGNHQFFERQHGYGYMNNQQAGNYDSGYVPALSYNGPPIYGPDGYSRNTADHYYNSEYPYHSHEPSESGHVLNSDNIRRSRENLSTLHRTRSCSEIDFEDPKDFLSISDDSSRRISRASTPTIENTERRKYYPLAQVPIPSFAEFKRKNSRIDDIKNHVEEIESIKNRTETSKKQHQRSYSDKDLKTTLRETVIQKELVKENNSKPKTTNDETLKDKNNYSHNDVIHNLMLKYGLYERREKKKETRNTSTKTDKEIRIASKIESFLESMEKKDKSKNSREDSSPSPQKDAKPTQRSPRGQRRRASAAVVQNPNIVTPKLTRKSKSTIGPDSLERTEDENNNTRTKPIIKEELSSRSSPSLGSRYRELTASKSDLTSIADVYKTARQTSVSSMSTSPDDVPQSASMDSGEKKAASKTLWEAAKTRLKLGKSPTTSPLARRKAKEQSNKDNLDNASTSGSPRMNDEKGKRLSRNDLRVDDDVHRRMSLEPSPQGQLQKGGIHTSLLSIASSICSENDLDDSCSIHSADERSSSSSRRRWESFHSTISADSGSAQMFDFENDSMTMEDPFDDRELSAEPMRKKSDTEIERTDSGIGGDIGRHHKQSWEDIVLKSSRHWSIVAASARHWKEVAMKNKIEKYTNTGRRKSAGTPVITEDMVECADCQKYFIPEPERSDRATENASKPKATICQKCRERRVERKEAIIELVQTEINYANDLQILKEEFYSPLQSGGILQPDNLSEIFLNLQELVEVSTKFSNRLQNALEESVSKGNEEFSHVNVGNIFLESVDFFQSYEIYCTKQNAASSLLESLQKKNELLKIFLNVTCRENPKCRKMDLNSFLLAPVQRIMKYPLLLSRIRKATPRRNTDREKLMQAQRKIEDQLNRINALNSTVESRPKRYRGSGHLGRSDSLDKLQMKKMASEILNWAMGEMTLLMHGVFEVVIHEFISASGWSRRGSKRTVDVFMLFCVLGLSEPKTVDSDEDTAFEEDPLFPSDAEATDAALVMLKKKMNGKYTLFKEPLSLNSCIVCKDSDHKDCFEIINMTRETYVFKAASIKESKKWLKHLRLQAKDLGAWKKRRNGLPNIMIKTI